MSSVHDRRAVHESAAVRLIGLEGRCLEHAHEVVPGDASLIATLDGVTQTVTLTVLAPPQPPPPPAADTIGVDRVEYDADKNELRVRLTGSEPSAIFSIYSVATGELIGTITGDGSGEFRAEFSYPVNPGEILIESSFGGSTTANVRAK